MGKHPYGLLCLRFLRLYKSVSEKGLYYLLHYRECVDRNHNGVTSFNMSQFKGILRANILFTTITDAFHKNIVIRLDYISPVQT